MIEIEPTIYQIKEAISLYKFNILPNSMTKGEKNFMGALGEIVVRDYYREIKNKEVIHESTKDYDMIIEGVKVDIKTKGCTTKPLPRYKCVINETSLHQKPQYYIFCRYDEDENIMYILGGISKLTFNSISRFAKEGDIDDESHNNFTFKANCYWCRISELTQINKS